MLNFKVLLLNKKIVLVYSIIREKTIENKIKSKVNNKI